ncbi:MAG: NTP transferase domain-containing protein, partial [Gammaproteobacteria bacterium]|nr:NTP transferase domain-containing protein [Gammaproteobacteria bacterium]
MLPVAILAGGLATRMRPLTDQLPKSLLPVAGRPFIFHQLDLLRNQGVERVVLCVAHLGEQIRAAVGSGATSGVAVCYSSDGGKLLGTAGALKRALPLLGDEFFVMNGDSYLRCSMAAIQSAYEAARRPALMTVLRNDNRWGKSNVMFENGKLLLYDKQTPRAGMCHIDFGLSVVSRGLIAACAEAMVIDLADVLRNLSLDGQLAALEVKERFYEIGSA